MLPRGTYELDARRADDVGGAASKVQVPVCRKRPTTGWDDWLPATLDAPCDGARRDVKLVLIGGGRLMRDATANLLAAQAGIDVQGAFTSAAHFLASDLEEQPEVLLLDCDGDSSRYWSSVGSLVRAHTTAKIVMLCQELSGETIRCAMENRVSGVILKSYSTEDIRQAIEYMASGRTIMPVGWQRAAGPSQRDPQVLSPRLREILTLIAQGHSNEEIAAELALSPNTVKFHVRALYARLGVRNRVEATLQYTQMTRGAS